MSPESNIPRQLILNFPTQREFTFSNFSVSKGSLTAYASAQKIAGTESTGVSSLFLHGAKNLGKTHLLIAIGNELAVHSPEKNTCYVDVGTLLNSASDTHIPNAKIALLAEADVVLFDALDGIENHPILQENLYHVYNSLAEKGGTTVFSSRSHPRDLRVADYLESRFLWGMTADIQPFDPESMEQVIIKLGHDAGLVIPPAGAHYIINRIDRNFSAMKKTVDILNEYSFRKKCKVTVPLIKEALNL